ncbi:hypothetical protein [Streptomyces sp. NBC_00687]|uniref:hypothetical protein n=1 Tax=Streptomyces sp. NBC_00687 TaxID=2975807 RepID=UPI0022561247|nr:hypothetical protein [Streptomyces sp. NBC_00687]MCX4919032.1 hypothetical protein [Streptomyces sp. NBC_00687]
MSRPLAPRPTARTLPPTSAASPRGGSRPKSAFVHYPVLGLLMGGLWAYNHGASLWEHTERLLLIALVVPPLLERLRIGRRRRLGRESEPRVSLLRLTLLKLAVVALALVATSLLREKVATADYWAAGGMALVVAAVGPALHPYMIVRPNRSSASQSLHRS